MSERDDEALREFKAALLAVTQLFGFISNDEVFKKEHGFSMTEYIGLRRSCSNEIRELADSIERVVRDTGIARTTGGSVAVASGAAALGGILLAPFTAGASLALTVGGIAGGVASAATTQLPSSKTRKSTKKRRKLSDCWTLLRIRMRWSVRS